MTGNRPRAYSDEADEELLTGFKKAKKKMVKVQKDMSELRLEQIQYMLNTFKILIIFLRIIKKLGNLNQVKDQARANIFITKLDLRIKTTFFVMI